MKIIEKFKQRQENLNSELPVIAFLGDSVTQGCFEIYQKDDGNIDTIFEPENSYPRRLAKIFATIYPKVPPVIVNAGISGDVAKNGLARLERDILRFKPDLTVVSFGLNDCGLNIYDDYVASLREIFTKLQENGSEVIFLAPNSCCSRVSEKISLPTEREIAAGSVAMLKEGRLDKFFNGAKQVAKECGVTVCVVYSMWRQMDKAGVDITELLSNYINHPVREMYQLFADELFKCIMN